MNLLFFLRISFPASKDLQTWIFLKLSFQGSTDVDFSKTFPQGATRNQTWILIIVSQGPTGNKRWIFFQGLLGYELGI